MLEAGALVAQGFEPTLDLGGTVAQGQELLDRIAGDLTNTLQTVAQEPDNTRDSLE